ncbi:phage protein [Marinomonas primoryensis]|uniref:phage protein n=1 Tax=Marinomonas primoryensis TaxID=178399 RepID=UPI0037048855|tara:strand:+ start:632 stop:1090 length:459 start_codon:yes stop_codon:yes gene_type:complete
MSTHHISGMDVNVSLGTALINVKQFTLNIEDGMKETTTRGVANGFVNGVTGASGEITVDTENFNRIIEEARKVGSYQQLPAFDIISLGQTVNQKLKTAAYGCKLSVSKLIDAAGDGGDKLEHTIPYKVTDSRFVEINGVPYLDQNHLETLGL